MTVDELLSRLECVRTSGRGFLATCPAHDDRSPSLNIHQGDLGILLRCWAGCTVEEIASALGLSLKHLFYDSALSREQRWKTRSRTRRFDWRRFAGELEDDAMDHWLRAETVLKSARYLSIAEWTDEDLDAAIEAVCCAHADLARADALDRLAVNIRIGGLRKEQHESESRRSAAR